MTEERYQYLKSLTLEEYEKEATGQEIDEYCRIAAERGETEYLEHFDPS